MAQGLAQALASTAARRAPALAGGAAAAGAAHSTGTNAPGALALALGAAGLVPFLALAPHGDAALPLPEWVSERRVALQKSYGACILRCVRLAAACLRHATATAARRSPTGLWRGCGVSRVW